MAASLLSVNCVRNNMGWGGCFTKVHQDVDAILKIHFLLRSRNGTTFLLALSSLLVVGIGVCRLGRVKNSLPGTESGHRDILISV